MLNQLTIETRSTSMTSIIDQYHGRSFSLYNGDCIEVIKGIPDNSIGFSVFSPPFSSLFVYSNSPRDLGNSRTYSEFYEHYKFLAKEQFRTLMPGRLMSVHCMNLPMTIQHHGHIGIQDFRGDLIRLYEEMGFIYHSEVCIYKDPVTAMQRTKAIGLLYKQLKKDSALSRQGIPDYLVTFRKPGVNPEPITKDPDEFPVGLWQRYASPVWMDINPSNTLQKESAREQADERHIAPLQLEVIERAIQLWTNPNDIVFSPFAGIGSEVYQAVKMGRRGIGIELKPSYYRQAVLNCQRAEQEAGARTLFDLLDEQETAALVGVTV
jgi:DNA modification methylase